jgi:hypothetical protein
MNSSEPKNHCGLSVPCGLLVPCGQSIPSQFKSNRRATWVATLVGLVVFGSVFSGCVTPQTRGGTYPSDQAEVGPYPEHSHDHERFPKHQHDYVESTRHTHQYDPPPTQRQPEYGRYPRHSHEHERYPTHRHDDVESTYHTHNNQPQPDIGRYPGHSHEHERYPRHRHSYEESRHHTHQNDQGQDQRPRYGQYPQHSHQNERYPKHQHDLEESTWHTHRNDAPPQGGYGRYPRHTHDGERYPRHQHGYDESTRHTHQATPPPPTAPTPPVIDFVNLRLTREQHDIIRNYYFDLNNPNYIDRGRKNRDINKWLRSRRQPLPSGLKKKQVLAPHLKKQKLPNDLIVQLQKPLPPTKLVIVAGHVVHIHKPSQIVVSLIRDVAHPIVEQPIPVIDYKGLTFVKGTQEIIKNYYFDLAHPDFFNNRKKEKKINKWLKNRDRPLPKGLREKQVLPPNLKKHDLPTDLIAKLQKPLPQTNLVIVAGNVILIHKPTQTVLEIIRNVVFRKDGRHWDDPQ